MSECKAGHVAGSRRERNKAVRVSEGEVHCLNRSNTSPYFTHCAFIIMTGVPDQALDTLK